MQLRTIPLRYLALCEIVNAAIFRFAGFIAYDDSPALIATNLVTATLVLIAGMVQAAAGKRTLYAGLGGTVIWTASVAVALLMTVFEDVVLMPSQSLHEILPGVLVSITAGYVVTYLLAVVGAAFARRLWKIGVSD